MSNFELAIPVVFKHEGVFSNDPDDPGGPTKYGISLRFLAQSGQGDFNNDGYINVEDVKNMTKKDAEQIYRQSWWVKYGYWEISDQNIATKVFDLSVNMGSRQAHKILQRAVWSVMGVKDYIADDGHMGKMTLASVNQINNKELIPAIRSEAASFYRSLNKPKYINGWLNRAYA